MYRLIAMSFVFLLAIGCGGGLDTASVTGIITLDGEPLANASVTFSPKATNGEAPASNGATDSTGAYNLTVTTTRDKGAVIGRHTVTITLIMDEPEGDDADVAEPADEDPIPDHDFSFEVKPGDNSANFDLETNGGS
jgi:hypothetical protein